MKKILYLILFFFVICASNLRSQNRGSCITGDTLQFNLNNFRGNVLWEESEDSMVWTNTLNTSSNLVIQPSVTPKWIRAKIEEENCPDFLESPIRVWAIDTSISTYSRTNFSVNDINGQLVSANEGLIIYNITSDNFDFNAGDYIYGLSGQEYLLAIDAYILYQNVLYLYTSETSISVYDSPLNFGPTMTTKLRGHVLDEDGNGLFGAKVKIGNDSVYTDAKGVFQFEVIQAHEGYDFVKVTKREYFDGFKGFIAKEAGNELIITMLQSTQIGWFNATAGATVEHENYRFEFPANAITLNGNAYTGIVSVRMKELNPDSANFQESMPGALLGNYYGETRSLLSLGMFSIKLTTSSGQELEIAEGQTVTTTYTLSQQLAQVAPDSIDLWSFDELNGYWICEGIAHKVDGSYVAEFKHFSFWNYDFPFPPAYLHGVVLTASGNPFSGATVQISSGNFQSGSDITNQDGAFGGLVPKNIEFTIQVFYDMGNGYQPVSENIVIPPITSETFYIVINELNSSFYQVTGNAVDCDLTTLNNAYVIHGGGISYLNNGNFTYYSSSALDSFKLVSENPTVIGQWQIITLNEGINDIGTIQLCNGDTFLTGTLSDYDGNQYPSVLIGDVWWMAKELRTTHFSDGSPITLMAANSEWSQATSAGYCFYDNNLGNAAIYGNIYNGYAIVDSRNVCPAGWHVPTTNEYLQMVYLIGMLPSDLFISELGIEVFRGTEENIGGKLKSTSYWQTPNIGATNEIGFSAVPLGNRTSAGGYNNLGLYGNYWLYDGFDGVYPISGSYAPGYNESGMYYDKAIINYKNGNGLRCVKND